MMFDGNNPQYAAIKALLPSERLEVLIHFWETDTTTAVSEAWLTGYLNGLERGFRVAQPDGWMCLTPEWERAWREAKR